MSKIDIRFKRQIVKSGSSTSYMIAIPPMVIETMGLKIHQKMWIEPQDDGIFLRIVKEEDRL